MKIFTLIKNFLYFSKLATSTPTKGIAINIKILKNNCDFVSYIISYIETIIFSNFLLSINIKAYRN